MTWQLQEAGTRFSDLLDASIHEGPQVVARDGKEMAVLVPIDHWKRLQREAPAEIGLQRPTLKEVLMAPFPIVEDLMIPERTHMPHREPPEF